MTHNKRRFVLIALFAVLGFLALQVPIARLEGSRAAFTLFDLFAPIAPAFLGLWPGVVAVLLMQLSNFFWHGAQVADAGTIIRFFPILFGALYFGSRNRIVAFAIPLLAIAAFVAHPVGRTVWYFSLFWLIPPACYLLYKRFLFARALGATFTAHAVGGVLWIYVFALPAAAWQALVPIVIQERLIFAAGIAVSYVVLNAVLGALGRFSFVREGVNVDSRYALRSR